MRTLTRKLKQIIFLSFIFIITVAFNFQHNPPSNWYQQFLPNIYTQQINDMTFLDSLTGFIVTSRNVNPDTAMILKTTNGGDNWLTVFSQERRKFNKVRFINNITGFACGGTGSGTPYLYKTTNAGVNWFTINSSGCAQWDDMFILNEDTIWVVDHDGLCGGVFRTTNGGVNWTQQLSLGNQNPNHIYFYNKDIGFIASGELYKTTNSGVNWFNTHQTPFFQMNFIDENTGWKCYGPIQKTTNGGLNWVSQTLPSGNYILQSSIIEFSVLNKDTIWGVGGYVQYPNSTRRGMVYVTTNGGTNWYYQVPDTSIVVFRYEHVKFLDNFKGWAYGAYSGIHTKVGGDPITSITYTKSQIPKNYILHQNYPNPFNPNTAISFQLLKAQFVKIKVYDIKGKEIQTLVNEKKNSGAYEVLFKAEYLSSGIYFYTLQTENYKETKKMMLLK